MENIWMLYFLKISTNYVTEQFFEREKNIASKQAINKNIRKEFNNFSPYFLRNRLYSTKKREQVYNLYKDLSGFTHSSIIGSLNEFKFNLEVTEDILKYELKLSVSTLCVGYELYPKAVSVEFNDKINNYINTVSQKVGHLFDLIPNNLLVIPHLLIPEYLSIEL